MAVLRARGLVWALAVLLGLFTWTDLVLRTFVPALGQPHWPTSAYWVAARLAWEGNPSPWYDTPAFGAAAVRLGTDPDIWLPNAPTGVLPFLPVGLLPETEAHVLWLYLSLFALVVALALFLAALRVSPTGALLVTALVPLFQPVRHNINQGQAYLFVFLVLVAGASWAVVRPSPIGHGPPDSARRSGILAGLCFGAIWAVKLYYGAALLLPPLVQRRWPVVAAACAVFGAAVLATILLWGPELWIAWLGPTLSWGSRPQTTVTAYQTINGLLGHVLRFDATWNPGPVADLPGLVGPMWTGLALLVSGLSVAALWHETRQPATDIARRLLPSGLVVLVTLLLSPVAEDYHYGLALFPVIVAGVVLAHDREARAGGPSWRLDPRGVAALAVFAVSVVLLGHAWAFNVPGVEGWRSLLYYPRVYGALMLWGLILVLIWRGESVPAREAVSRR